MIISRTEALERGLKTYFTGRPCKHGHIDFRSVSNHTCVACQLLKAKAAYAAKPDKYKARRMARYMANTDQEKANMRAYYQQNGERGRESRKLRYWQNADGNRAISNQWRIQNPSKRRSAHAKRRAAKRQRLPTWFGELDQLAAQEAADLARIRSEQTGFEWHVDHMVPLQAKCACGLHCAANLQVIPGGLNIRKRNKLILTEPFEWTKASSAT